jgi:GxxExxY protein
MSTVNHQEKFPYKEETYKIIGACMNVYNELGRGFLEPVYQESLEIELSLKNIPFVAQERVEIEYKGHILNKMYIPDFVCYGKIIVEIKALSKLSSNETAQILNALKASEVELGLLVNFGHSSLQYKRYVW